MDKKVHYTDPRILRTRQLIKNAFVELLQEIDIKKISVSRIAERATINRVTFYLHYQDIPNMLEKLADEMTEEIRKILTENQMYQDSPTKGNWIAIEKMFEHFAEHADFYQVVLAKKQVPIFQERLFHLVTEFLTIRLEKMEEEAWMRRGNIPKDITTWYFSSALIGTLIMWLRNEMPYSPASLTQQFALLITR